MRGRPARVMGSGQIPMRAQTALRECECKQGHYAFSGPKSGDGRAGSPKEKAPAPSD